jgi:hypothetical protein
MFSLRRAIKAYVDNAAISIAAGVIWTITKGNRKKRYWVISVNPDFVAAIYLQSSKSVKIRKIPTRVTTETAKVAKSDFSTPESSKLGKLVSKKFEEAVG